MWGLVGLLLLGQVSAWTFQPVSNANAPNGLGVSNKIVSTYATDVQLATFKLDMNTPGVSATDLGAITNVQCNNKGMVLSLANEEHYKTAMSWPTPMTFFTTHDYECNGSNGNQLFHVTKIQGMGMSSRNVLLTASPVKLGDHATAFSLEMNQYNSSSMRKRTTFSGSTTFSLDANSSGGKVTASDIVLLSAGEEPTTAKVLCAECFSSGSLTAAITATGSFTPPFISTAQVQVSGNLDVNVDISIEAEETLAKVSSPPVTIASIPLTAGSIPDIVEIGPVMKLVGTADVSVDLKGTIKFGVDLSFPQFTSTLDLVNSGNSGASGFTPQVNVHPPETGAEAGVTGTLNLIPELVVGINILHGTLQKQAGIEFTASISGTAGINDKNGCGSNGGFQASLGGSVGGVINSDTITIASLPSTTLVTLCGPGPYSSGSASKSQKRRLSGQDYAFTCPEGTTAKRVFGQFICE